MRVDPELIALLARDRAIRSLGELAKKRQPTRADAFAAMRLLIAQWGRETAREIWWLARPTGGKWQLKLVERSLERREDDHVRRRRRAAQQKRDDRKFLIAEMLAAHYVANPTAGLFAAGEAVARHDSPPVGPHFGPFPEWVASGEWPEDFKGVQAAQAVDYYHWARRQGFSRLRMIGSHLSFETVPPEELGLPSPKGGRPPGSKPVRKLRP